MFSIGCKYVTVTVISTYINTRIFPQGLNIFFGLVFRASAKSKRSILSWREEKKNILPTSVHFTDKSDASTFANSKPGYGFGKHGEKAAARSGMCHFLPFINILGVD